MAEARKFTASTTSDEKPNLPFTLDGIYRTGTYGSDGATSWAESFEAFGTPSAGVAPALQHAFVEDARGKMQLNPGVVMPFIHQVLVPDSAVRFAALIEDPDRLVTLDALADVFAWLTEVYTDRPTVSSGS